MEQEVCREATEVYTIGRYGPTALGNLAGVACIIIAWWEVELDRKKLNARLNRQIDPSDVETAVTTG
jgi:hypothetical protein